MEGSLARALFSFQSSNPEDLSVPEGGIIRICQYIDKHWLQAEYQGQTGFFPVSYAVRLDGESQQESIFLSAPVSNTKEARENLTPNGFRQCDNFSGKQPYAGKSFTVEASFGFVARNETELSVPTGAIIEVTKDVDDDWLEGSFNGCKGLFPKSYVKSDERPRARAIYPFVGESVGELTFREGDCIYLHKRLNSQWMEGEISGNVGLFPSSFVVVEIDLPLDKGKSTNRDFLFEDSTSWRDKGHKNASTPSKIQWKKGMKGKAKFHFSALYLGDLELNEGDVITVLRLDDDNWLEGQLANGLSGLCPTAYLEPVHDSNDQWVFGNQTSSQRNNLLGVSHSQFRSKEGTGELSNYSYGSSFRKQDDEIFESFIKSGRTDASLLDSSFTQDPTPLLLPYNSGLDQQPKAWEKNTSLLHSDPITKSSEGYSVTYLGSGEGYHHPTQRSYNQTTTSPSTWFPSLLDERATLSGNRALSGETMSISNATSRQPEMNSQGSSSSSMTFYDSARTRPSKRNGIHGFMAGNEVLKGEHFVYDQDYDDDGDDDDLLSGNCTSLPSPLLPLPRREDNDKIESSTLNDFTITPKRPAPPPPKRNWHNINQATSNTLRTTSYSKASSQGRISQRTSLRARGQGVWQHDDRNQRAAPVMPSPPATKRESSISPKGSPRMRHGGGPSSHKTLSRPQQSQLTEGSYAVKEWRHTELHHSNRHEQVDEGNTGSDVVVAATSSDPDLLHARQREEPSGNRGTLSDETDVPGLVLLKDRIAETEQNLKKEMNVYTGFKSIAQLVMTDPVKQREMEVKVSQSQQKITEWQEELKQLQDEKVFLMESHRKKMLKNKISHLEADLEKQLRSQRSLEMLLGVVEENRKREVMDNLSVCAQLVEKIKKELSELEASLHDLTEKPAASSQKHMAEQRQRVVTELVNTERDYCNDLELCVKYFLIELQPLQVKDLDCEGLFGNIESVLETAKKLLKSLEKAMENKEGKDQELGKCFVDIAEEMKEVYAVYCRNHDDAISLMEKYEDMPEIQDAFSKCLEKIREHTRCWDLSSFLIKPVQRVLKYPLLLSELLKYTPEIHQDKYNLIQAISVMTDVANAINEFKRRKDLVIKYKKVEDSGLTNMIQKLNWHSVVKKGNRFNQRLTQLTGLVSQTVDENFIEEEKKFRGIEKTVKVLWKNISTYLAEFQEAMECGQASGDNVSEFYQDAATCTEVSTFYRIQKTIGEAILTRFMDTVQVQVLSPLNTLLSLFQGPQRLIQKRNDKCLDYDSWSNKIDKIKDREKLKTAKEELELAKKNYEALNTQLLEEIPGFTQKCMSLVVDCLKNFTLAHNRFYHQIQQEYQQLLQLPLIQSLESDIVEHHSKRSVQVIEQFADLSFIPCSFVAKDSARKKRRSIKSPNVSTHDPDSTEDDKEMKLNSLDSGLSNVTGIDNTHHSAPPPTLIQPRPAPRRISSTMQPESRSAESPEILLTPGEEDLHVVEFNFEAQTAGELSVSEGEIVSVLRYSDTRGNPEWWLIQLNGATGYVPQSFLSPVNESEFDNVGTENDIVGDDNSSIGTTRGTTKNRVVDENRTSSLTQDTKANQRYYAEFEFEASSPAELSLEEGQNIVILQKQDLTGNHEWWLVEAANGRKGYVPSNYLTAVED